MVCPKCGYVMRMLTSHQMSTDSNIEKRAIMEIFADDHLPVYTATTETILQKMSNEMNEAVRTFATGATRSPLGDKLEYEGYLNPLVLKRFAEYMKKHQIQADGNKRAADNWQKNIPKNSLMDSAVRHFMDWWLHHRGYHEEAIESKEEALCALLFNAMAYLKQEVEER